MDMDSEYVHEPLVLRLWIFVVLSIVMLALVVYHITTDRTGLLFPFLGVVMGTFVGILVSRTYKIAWDDETEKVIFKLDIYGFCLLVIYFIFEIWRDDFVGYFVHGPALATTSLAALAGIMIGRVLGIRGKITSVLKENL